MIFGHSVHRHHVLAHARLKKLWVGCCAVVDKPFLFVLPVKAQLEETTICIMIESHKTLLDGIHWCEKMNPTNGYHEVLHSPVRGCREDGSLLGSRWLTISI